MPKIIHLPKPHFCLAILNNYMSANDLPRTEGTVLACDCGAEFELIVHPRALQFGFKPEDASRIWQRYEPPF